MRVLYCLLALLVGCTAREQGGWRVDPSPELSIGGIAGDSAQDLSRVLAARRFPDGTLVIANGATSELRWFDASGRHLRSVGRGTSGIRSMGAVFADHDTLLVWDERARSLSRWSPAGTQLGARRILLADSTRAVSIRGSMGGGQLLVQSGAPVSITDAQRVVRSSAGLFRVDAMGRSDSIGAVSGDQLFVRRVGNDASIVRLPFGAVTVITTRPGGFLVATGDTPTFTAYDSAGTVERSVRWAASREPVTTADRDRYLRLMLGAARSGPQASEIRNLWERMPLPDSLPYVTTMVRDVNDLVWVRQPAHLTDSTAAWRVIGRSGEELATLHLPARATPVDIGTDRMVMHMLDEAGVERVQVHRLRRPPT